MHLNCIGVVIIIYCWCRPKELPTVQNPAIDLILKINIAILISKKLINLQLMSFLTGPGTCCTKSYII